MSELRIVVLGVGDFSSAKYYSTCFAAVAADGQWMLLDCPHPIRKILRDVKEKIEAPVELPLDKLVGVALTHMHADHCSGLEGLGYHLRIQQVQNKVEAKSLPVVVGPQVALRFREHTGYKGFLVAKKEGGPPIVNLVVLTPGDKQKLGPFELETHWTNHGDMPCYAFRVRCGDRSFAHSADTRYDPELLQWLALSDHFTHEVGTEDTTSKGHTTFIQLASWFALQPDDLREKLRMVHFDDDFIRPSEDFRLAVEGEVIS